MAAAQVAEKCIKHSQKRNAFSSFIEVLSPVNRNKISIYAKQTKQMRCTTGLSRFYVNGGTAADYHRQIEHVDALNKNKSHTLTQWMTVNLCSSIAHLAHTDRRTQNTQSLKLRSHDNEYLSVSACAIQPLLCIYQMHKIISSFVCTFAWILWEPQTVPK